MGKPTLKQFSDAVQKKGGNLTKVAELFRTSRTQIYRWIEGDENFKNAVLDARMKLFDECLSVARTVSLGIPRVEDGTIVGWAERPDSGMLRYLISTLGRREGFGESLDITSGGEKIENTPLVITACATNEEIEAIKKQITQEAQKRGITPTN